MTLEEMKGLFKEAALYASNEEVQEVLDQIQDDLKKARDLADQDLSDVNPLNIITDNTIELREDEIREGFDREEALSYTEERQYGYFKIKRVVE